MAEDLWTYAYLQEMACHCNDLSHGHGEQNPVDRGMMKAARSLGELGIFRVTLSGLDKL